jgi:fatty aldehyde-generating acyl-ACP reductase
VDTFAFIIHPIDSKRDISRKYPFLGRIANDWMIYNLSPFFPPVYLSEVEGIMSESTGKQIKGWLIACPLSPQHFKRLPEKRVYRKIIETGRLAERLGAQILGLGAFTSVVGDAGLTISKALDVPVTTGDSYTIAVAVQAIQEAAQLLDIQTSSASAAVVGATGAIGKVCAEILSKVVAELLLVGLNLEALDRLRQELILRGATSEISISANMEDLLCAQLILTVTSSTGAVIKPQHISPGSIICDVARPRDVSAQVKASREDVLVIDGGLVEVPGNVDFHFNFGLPPGKTFACMAETIALALEGRFEDYTIGKDITIDRVQEITQLAKKHGFRLSGFRSFEQPVSEAAIERVRQKRKELTNQTHDLYAFKQASKVC